MTKASLGMAEMEDRMYYSTFSTTLCPMTIVGDEHGICALHFHSEEGKRQFIHNNEWVENTSFFQEAIDQINGYLANTRNNFDLKLNPVGTPFQLQVWEGLMSIPYGSVATYKEIASKLGNPNASRAVGMANSKNPIPLIIPCHRVIGANGNLTGFAFGLGLKKQLLGIEQSVV